MMNGERLNPISNRVVPNNGEGGIKASPAGKI